MAFLAHKHVLHLKREHRIVFFGSPFAFVFLLASEQTWSLPFIQPVVAAQIERRAPRAHLFSSPPCDTLGVWVARNPRSWDEMAGLYFVVSLALKTITTLIFGDTHVPKLTWLWFRLV